MFTNLDTDLEPTIYKSIISTDISSEMVVGEMNSGGTGMQPIFMKSANETVASAEKIDWCSGTPAGGEARASSGPRQNPHREEADFRSVLLRPPPKSYCAAMQRTLPTPPMAGAPAAPFRPSYASLLAAGLPAVGEAAGHLSAGRHDSESRKRPAPAADEGRRRCPSAGPPGAAETRGAEGRSRSDDIAVARLVIAE